MSIRGRKQIRGEKAQQPTTQNYTQILLAATLIREREKKGKKKRKICVSATTRGEREGMTSDELSRFACPRNKENKTHIEPPF